MLGYNVLGLGCCLFSLIAGRCRLVKIYEDACYLDIDLE